MEDKIAFRKGEYDFDYPTGHVQVTIPRNIYLSKIAPAFGQLARYYAESSDQSASNNNID